MSSLLERYRAVRAATEQLAEPLGAEDQVVQTMPDVSPTKWHRAHTTWFFETFVLRAVERGFTWHHPRYAYLFNSYYEAVGPQFPRPQRGLLSRPTVQQVGEYRAGVDARMEALLASPERLGDTAAVVELGLQHEQQHQELLVTDIKHVLGTNPLWPAYREGIAPPSTEAPPPVEWRRFDGGLCAIGHDGEGFRFDNEGPRHQVWLAPFQLASRTITCGEFLEFVRDGGYRQPLLWLSEGWAMARSLDWEAPLYWEPREGGWWLYTLGGGRPLDPTEPVTHLSYFEADAYASWVGARLPTEQEWEVAAASADPAVGNLADDGRLHPGAAARGAPAALFGDVWEWTRSPYSPYPGYRPAAGALGEYNGKFMVNQQVLRGGSCATPRGHLRSTYRNFFPPSARWQFSGVRLARDA